MRTLEVNYTKRYFKTITKNVEIPDGVNEDEWLEKNKLELFEDEITAASLVLEDDEIEIFGDENITVLSEEDEKQPIIDKINAIIDKYGEFGIYDVEADHSPHINSGSGSLSHLMEDFAIDGGKVYTYDPRSHSSDEIDRYDADYYDLDIHQLEYVLTLAEKWKEFMEE